MQAAAALSFAAACVHGSVMVTHFREYWLFGVFFAVVTPLQIVWGGLAWRRPANDLLLKVGALGNLAIVAVWMVSRTIGLPIGPEALEAEGVGVKDVLASWNEVMLAVLVFAALAWSTRRLPRWPLVVGWTLAGVSIVAALIAGNGH